MVLWQILLYYLKYIESVVEMYKQASIYLLFINMNKKYIRLTHS